MDLGIKDKWALVTGASKGLGQAIARQLASEGARIIAVARSKDKLSELINDLPEGSNKHIYVCADLLEDSQLQSLCKFVIDEQKIPEIIVHNLGGSLGVTDSLSESSAYEKVWKLNLGISIDINSKFIPFMQKKSWGRIVHISSASASTYHGYTPYVAAKCALTGYVKSASRNIAKDNVILSAVAPGPIHNEGRYFAELVKNNSPEIKEYFKHHLAIERLGQPNEIASAVVFLCSRHATLASGSIFEFNGGSM
jgi:3-oxoacyl-[acyl-carrier protein] reductase